MIIQLIKPIQSLYGLKTEMRYTKELLYYGVVPKNSDNVL